MPLVTSVPSATSLPIRLICKENYLDEARRYYVNIVGVMARRSRTSCAVRSPIDVGFARPSGFVFRTPETIKQYIVDKHLHWAQYVPEKKGVVIAFSSIYGNTEQSCLRP